MSVRDACFQCNRPGWQHERDKYGNIVRKAQYRDNSSPPICVPSRLQQRRLEAEFGKKAAFRQQVRGRRVA